MPVQIEKLQKVPYFSELTLNELESIRRLAIEKIVARGELIVMEGDAPASIYFLISGAVKMFKTSPDGKEQIFHIACPGESFNEVSALDGNANMFSVQSMGEVTLYEINREDFLHLTEKYATINRQVIRNLTARTRKLAAIVEDFSFKNVIGRVAKILLDTAIHRPCEHPKLTQQEMAAIAGTSREVVGRSLKALEEAGAIRIEHHRIVLQSRQKLEEVMR